MGQRLLIVDSDRMFLAEQRAGLEAAFEVEILASPGGESLLSRVESGDIAAVLICVEVSENKGYAYCTNLRKLQVQKPALAGIKVALISSKATEEEYKRHQGLKGRADLYLHKPIPPGALVAALSQLVPPRPVDPNNPLGDLADSDVEDIFSGLKSLEVDQLFEKSAPPSATTQRLAPVKTAPPRTTHADIAQAQMEGLMRELESARAEAQAARAELERVQRHMDSATRSLEELAQREQESAQLQGQLIEAKNALARLEGSTAGVEALKAQLRAALEEKQQHLQHIEELNQQVAGHAQQTVELLRERDRLQLQVQELEPFKAQAEQAAAGLADAKREVQAAKARLEAMEDMLQRLPAAEKELAKAKSEAAQLEASLQGFVEKHQALEAAHDALQTELSDRIRDISGLEATMRSQGLELAQIQEHLQEVQAEAQDLAEKLNVKDENLEKMGNEIFSISAQRNDLQTRLEDSIHAREAERMELMQGLDGKEAQLQDMQERISQLEREKRGLEGQLAERSDRLASLNALLTELSERLRKGADLAQG